MTLQLNPKTLEQLVKREVEAKTEVMKQELINHIDAFLKRVESDRRATEEINRKLRKYNEQRGDE